MKVAALIDAELASMSEDPLAFVLEEAKAQAEAAEILTQENLEKAKTIRVAIELTDEDPAAFFE